MSESGRTFTFTPIDPVLQPFVLGTLAGLLGRTLQLHRVKLGEHEYTALKEQMIATVKNNEVGGLDMLTGHSVMRNVVEALNFAFDVAEQPMSD